MGFGQKIQISFGMNTMVKIMVGNYGTMLKPEKAGL